MKNIVMFAGLTYMIFVGGCVSSDVAVAYAERAHPECTNHRSLNHSYGGEGGSQTEVQMKCDDVNRSITVKCIYGHGIISDTTCHENN